ncbi:MAG TPA: NlpC/P60 family protein [Pseudonocardia sp.]|nr:NlpC/P60 family protein [Pseudonocardia sp.]
MPLHLPALATRAAVAATTAAAAATFAALPAPTPAAAPPAPDTVRIAVEPVARATHGAGGSARAAAELAMSKIGAPYRWGADGPNAFDCSGLVQWAFGNAGIDLPRTSRAQSGVGERVSRSALQPGDLVFFYSPVSHVGIYIGDGRIVHASTSGKPVKVSDVDAMPFTTARRV